ncbi:TIGR04283 family arsenosugar biosynthesis glycosyltransferase [Terasakiella sp. A23]|uniref:TIGR04283 family arsenosugar biosynthesis glycosyltransferase n=1 Tax=Terasakiella sp. FCG-A23 TaxID=3080561 RepID=UPI002955A001|nr:TIGR04283 family arsenosugar biosynthesis glycosyltransferase [Terasakiella sp. A23]MDV7338279.1 TIGR04283 family arsenosugar biosynthesis glycosyltransferase [Terasakiella sp. A23]
MLSIVIPTYNTSVGLKQTVGSLVPPPYAREIIVVDGGSTDDTLDVAKDLDVKVVKAPKGRGSQLKAGGEAASGDWLLFLHADTILPQDWGLEVCKFIAEEGERQRAGYFTFALDDEDSSAKRLEKIVSWRCRLLGLPYGDQGLLISRNLYDEIGGFSDIPLMEDVDIVRRIGKRRLRQLSARAVTSAIRYRHHGYVKRSLRNFTCLTLYFLGVSPKRIVKLYG